MIPNKDDIYNSVIKPRLNTAVDVRNGNRVYTDGPLMSFSRVIPVVESKKTLNERMIKSRVY